jgi:hypothetical protein
MEFCAWSDKLYESDNLSKPKRPSPGMKLPTGSVKEAISCWIRLLAALDKKGLRKMNSKRCHGGNDKSFEYCCSDIQCGWLVKIERAHKSHNEAWVVSNATNDTHRENCSSMISKNPPTLGDIANLVYPNVRDIHHAELTVAMVKSHVPRHC